MCKVISVVNQKGGVGKTTTTVNVGIGLARECKKVLLIDADPQGSLTASLGYEEPDDLRITLATMMMDVINEEDINLEDGILHHQENVDLLPANIELSALEVTMGNVMSREMIMKEYIDAIRSRYDYILIDCMPSLGMMTINALVSSGSVLIPVQAAYLPVKGLQQLIKTILTVKKRLNRKLAIEGILLTMVDFRTNYAKEEIMEKKMTFNYFYGTEADQFSFYRIPKALFTDSYFKDLSSDAKILYGLMLDRMSLSIKNQWFDDKNRAYIYFSIEDIMELLNCGRNKAIKSMRELDNETGIGLIEKRRQGFGKVNVIYVKTFMPEKTDEKKFGEGLEKFKKQTSVENEEPAEVYNLNFMKSQNQTSRSPENKLQEVYISNPNNTNLSDTEMNDNKSNPIISVDEKRFDSDNRSEDYQAYENLVKETIDYESLEVTHHDDMRQVDEIVNLIVETVMCKNDKILIASNWYPASLVKKKFLMLTYSHIEYVLHCMRGNTTKVKNIKKYLLAALFNAPSTMNGYYQAEVNHDMPGLVR